MSGGFSDCGCVCHLGAVRPFVDSAGDGGTTWRRSADSRKIKPLDVIEVRTRDHFGPGPRLDI